METGDTITEVVYSNKKKFHLSLAILDKRVVVTVNSYSDDLFIDIHEIVSLSNGTCYEVNIVSSYILQGIKGVDVDIDKNNGVVTLTPEGDGEKDTFSLTPNRPIAVEDIDMGIIAYSGYKILCYKEEPFLFLFKRKRYYTISLKMLHLVFSRIVKMSLVISEPPEDNPVHMSEIISHIPCVAREISLKYEHDALNITYPINHDEIGKVTIPLKEL